jgi:3D (Asp-Asp-Asp) domain-containing protein
MSTSSIGKFLLIIIIFSAFNLVFSPSEAEKNIISEEKGFLKGLEPERRFSYFNITAYSSSPDETDDTPWLTAMNTVVRDGIVASNDLPLGTKIKIPSLFGDKIFVVEDRLNSRIKGVIDIWFPDKDSALNFGIYKDVLVEILE